MSNLYFKGENIFLYTKFEINDNSIISNAKVKILYDDNGTINTLLNQDDLIQIPNSNEYYYNYKLSYDVKLGQYNVIYSANVDDENAFAMETFYVIEKSDEYLNAIKLYGYITDIRTQSPLADTIILIKNLNDEIIFQSLSNEQGYWEGYVYPGEYTFLFKKSNFVEQQLSVQIGNELNEIQFNNVGLESNDSIKKGTGMFAIKDKYIVKTGQPIIGLDVKVYDIFNPIVPIAEDTTNEEGEWQCFLDPGTYLMKVINGETLNKKFSKTFRLKVNDNGESSFEDLSKNTPIMVNNEIDNSLGNATRHYVDNILDKNGNPIIDVQVNILGTNDEILAQDYTDENGQFDFHLDPGKYKVEYYHPSFKVINGTLNIE